MKEIEKIIQVYDEMDWTSDKLALGTVVKVEESAYRRICARMLVNSNGLWTGGISGGCLEGDALKRAQIAINKNENSLVVYDTMDDDSHQIGVGLGCNGRIEVMFTPVDQNNSNNPIEFLKSITTTRNSEILLQVLSYDTGENELLGAFFPINEIDNLANITGIPKTAFEENIQLAIDEKRSKVIHLSNSKNQKLELLIEVIRPKVKLICVGDNYDVNAFALIAKELGWEVHVAGKLRKLNKEIFKLSTSVSSYEDVPKIQTDSNSAVVLMSHDYKTDLNLLLHYLEEDVPYIGLLGPKKRMAKMQNELNEKGFNVDLHSKENLFAPVGLDIGAESPEEIALSISAEIIATLRKRDGGFLRKRIGPIHRRD